MAQNKYTRFVSVLYVVNIVAQAIVTLLIPIGTGLLCSYLSVRYLSAPDWIYALLVTVGAMSGLYSMIKFVLAAMSSLERLEKQHKSEKTGKSNEK